MLHAMRRDAVDVELSFGLTTELGRESFDAHTSVVKNR